MKIGISLLLVAGMLSSGCASGKSHDYSAYLAHMPRSILVLPPLNESPEVNAPYVFLSTISRPLAEAGYYVFPVAVVDQMMKENGLPGPGEMHQVPLQRIKEILGADAVFYFAVTRWGTEYHVIQSDTTVSVTARLVDVASGQTLWTGSQSATEGSGDGGGGIIGMLANALVHQVVKTAFDPSRDLSVTANNALVFNSDHGLLKGPYHPGQAADLEKRRK